MVSISTYMTWQFNCVAYSKMYAINIKKFLLKYNEMPLNDTMKITDIDFKLCLKGKKSYRLDWLNSNRVCKIHSDNSQKKKIFITIQIFTRSFYMLWLQYAFKKAWGRGNHNIEFYVKVVTFFMTIWHDSYVLLS